MANIRFSDDDIDILRQLADWFRKKRGKTRGSASIEDPPSPDVYVALTPAGGIWPLSGEHSTGTGTGTGTSIGQGNSPGWAECEIYKVSYNGQTPNLIAQGFTRRVHNLLEASIPGNRWVLIMRDKWGTWFIPPLSGLEIGVC